MKELIKSFYKSYFKEDLVQYIPCPIPEPAPIPVKTKSELLYETALTFLGQDASPKDYADDEYGCQETVDTIYHACFGEYIDPAMNLPSLKTKETYKFLLSSKAFIQPSEPMYGDIIISPTGYGNGNLNSGHTGILGKSNIIMSNNSSNGKWEENYTITTWKTRYKDNGGFPIVFFRKI